MNMKTLTTTACALTLGLAWGVAPGIAQDTTKEQAERKADRIEREAERKADRIEDQAQDKASQTRARGDAEADRVRGKTDGASGTVGDKMDRAWDKTKAKTSEMKDRITGDGAEGRGDVRAAQQALRDEGFNPGPIDGVMGPRTSAALRDFQQQEQLTVTGQLDAETRARLLDDGAPAASPGSGASSKRQTR